MTTSIDEDQHILDLPIFPQVEHAALVIVAQRLELAVQAWRDQTRLEWPELRYAARPAGLQADLDLWFERTGQWADPFLFHHIYSHSSVDDVAAEWLLPRFAPPPPASRSQKTLVRKHARIFNEERWGPLPAAMVYQSWVEAWKTPRAPQRVLLPAAPSESEG